MSPWGTLQKKRNKSTGGRTMPASERRVLTVPGSAHLSGTKVANNKAEGSHARLK